jgi:NitT/TauT family transport system substrate-binding protein
LDGDRRLYWTVRPERKDQEQAMATPAKGLQKVKTSMMNAVHDLPLLVARDEGFFRDEGLDVEILKTPGTGQHGSDHRALRDNIFKRTLEEAYEQGQCDQFRMCEWGIMKRAVESNVESGHRPAKIVALGSAMSSFAIVTDPQTGIYEPEQLKNVPIAVSPYNGSHFTMLKMMEGFIKRDAITTTNAGTHRERLDALRQGKVKAASLQEPWISVAEKQGCRVLIESHSTRSEAAGDELDGPTLAKMFRAEAQAAQAIQKHPEKYAHYLLEEAGGLIDLRDLKLARFLNAPPAPYTRERFDDNYQWTLGWGLVPPGATYENTVDNRAWQ